MTAIQDRPREIDVAESGSPVPRFAGAQLLAVAVAVVLSVTACLLWFRLPHVTVADHWSLAWVGLDVATASTAVMTALLLWAADPRAGLSSVAGAALLIVDAWFDVCTATPGPAHVVAVLEATLVELPVAGLAIWLALTLFPTRSRMSPARREPGSVLAPCATSPTAETEGEPCPHRRMFHRLRA